MRWKQALRMTRRNARCDSLYIRMRRSTLRPTEAAMIARRVRAAQLPVLRMQAKATAHLPGPRRQTTERRRALRLRMARLPDRAG